MKAMQLHTVAPLDENRSPLVSVDLPVPRAGAGELLVQVSVCAVCHTELDEIEGRLAPALPIIPGHQVIGRVAALGADCRRFAAGDRVGIAWIHSACGHCEYCLRGDENLCPDFSATGKDANGGYAEYLTVPEQFAYAIPEVFTDAEAAPLLCAGAIGYRSLQLSGLEDGQSLGLTGFGASAHLVLQMARYRYPNSPVFVFARNPQERDFALALGASWAGDSGDQPPAPLNTIIDTTPVWQPIVNALACLKPGGRLVINAIRKEDADKAALQSLDYPAHLWQEKEIKSVANVSRADAQAFLALAAQIPIKPQVERYPLAAANQALLDLKHKRIRGAKVLVVAE